MKIFISGASKGLGLLMAKEFLAQKHPVWGVGRSAPDNADSSSPYAGQFRYSQCDITLEENIKDTFKAMLEADFLPDIAIFCAGSASEDIVQEKFSLDKFEDNFRVNLSGVLRWVELMLPYFIQRKSGVFAAVSSMSIYRENHKNRIGYSASRMALNKSFENLRLNYLNQGLSFCLFTLGRLTPKQGLIGITYTACAHKIVKILSSGKKPRHYHIPFLQAILTCLARWIPDRLFYRYLLK